MISVSNSRVAAVLSNGILASFILLAFLGAPPLSDARPRQSSSAPSAQQQPVQDPAKKESAIPAPDSAAAKTNPPKPHRVFTNDDLSPSSGLPIPPGAYRRLKQLNRCDRTCFNDVKKQALSFGYITVFPRSTREEMDDRLANDIQELQNDPKWQRLLLEMISARLDNCLMRRKNSASQEDPPSHTPTRPELLDEEERMKNYRPSSSRNNNSAGSAVLAYRFSSRPDPLKASLMVHQYMDELRQECPVAQSTADSDDNSDDP
jgi:hypothetical protein